MVSSDFSHEFLLTFNSVEEADNVVVMLVHYSVKAVASTMMILLKLD